MPAPSPIRDILESIGLAVCRELVRLINERGRYPLRTNSALAKQLLSGQAIKVNTVRAASGRFAGYTADSTLTLVAQDYLLWLDTGRRPGGKKVPIAALLLFIKQRGLGQARDKRGKFGARSISANSLAWAMQRAIFKNGIKGRHVLEPAFALGQELVDIYLNNGLLDGMTLEIEQRFFATT